jgi:DNA-binding CsgD family transcriptional regulator
LNLRRGALVFWLAQVGRYDEAAAMGTSHLVKVEAVARPDEAVLSAAGDVQTALGLVAAVLGRPDAARGAFAQARLAHRAIDHHWNLAGDAGFELTTVNLSYRTTRLAERRKLWSEVEAALARMGGEVTTGEALHPLRMSYFLPVVLIDGVWPEVRALVEVVRAYAAGWKEQFVVGDLGWLARRLGLPVLAWDLVREALPDGAGTEPGGSLYLPSVALIRVAAELALDVDDLPAARAWLSAHDRWLAWSGALVGQADGHLLWARYYQNGGETALARQRAERALQRATEPRQPLALLHAHRRLGEIETASGRTAEAAAHLDRALVLADACAAPFERAQTLLALADLHATTGRTDGARAILDEIRSICIPLNAALTLARTDALAERLTSATSAGDRPAGLSVRELEVLRLVAEGLTDAEVADKLSISPRTVGQHLRSVYNKLDVPSRASATRFAVEHGLV